MTLCPTAARRDSTKTAWVKQRAKIVRQVQDVVGYAFLHMVNILGYYCDNSGAPVANLTDYECPCGHYCPAKTQTANQVGLTFCAF